MVKYILKNEEKFVVTDELYEALQKNGNKFLLEDITLSDDEIKEYKRDLYDYAWGKLKERAGYDVNTLNELIDMEEPQAIQYEINKMVTPNLFKSNNQQEVYKTLYKQASRLADASMNRLNDKRKAAEEEQQIKNSQQNLFKDEDNLNTSDENIENVDNKEFDKDSDIENDKRLVFVKQALSNNKIPLTNEQFQDIVGRDNIENLIKAYNELYYCGASLAESKAKLNELKNKYGDNLEEYVKNKNNLTQDLFDNVTKKWFNNVYEIIEEKKPNQVKLLNQLVGTTRKEDEDYDLQQEFALKGKAANDIIKRIKDIMRNVGKVNYVNYIFTDVPNLSTVKKYYLSELQTSASFGEDREIELKKIDEIREADNELFKQISKRLLVHGDINEYIKVIRYDDVLDGIFTVTRTERATTMGQQRTILTFTDNSTREVMFILVIEPTFGALKQFFKGIDTSGLKNAYNNLDKKL